MSRNATTSNRREFVQSTATLAALSGVGFAAKTQAAEKSESEAIVQPGDTVLFQGDSITDAGRIRVNSAPNQQKALGKGYAWLAAASMLVDRGLVDRPDGDLTVFNRGISGNKVFQLAERWQADCLDLKPNVLSILIGVNDIWHKLQGKYDGTIEVYEKDYHALIERTKAALPNVRLVICEPFVLRCGAIDESWFPEFDHYRAAARRVSDQAGATFVPFQAMFDRAVKYAPPKHWANDGVHPSGAGAALMAHTWLRTVGA